MSDSNYKYKFWVVTIKGRLNAPATDLPTPAKVISVFKSLGDGYTFQLERSENNMYHYQCCLLSKIRKTQKTMLNDLNSELNYNRELIEVDRSFDFPQSIKYCSDANKRVEDTPCYSTETSLQYSEEDIEFLDSEENRYPWQRKFMSIFFVEDETILKNPDDRTVYWVQDSRGNTGKSKFAKWLVRRYPNITKIAFGTSTQLRASVITEGPKQFYILDVPRTLGSDDSMKSVLSVIEDIKNGYVKSGMYGESRSLFITPPHVLVFSNMECPVKNLSTDRWKQCYINSLKELYCY